MDFLPIAKHKYIPRILGLGLFLQQLDSMILNTSIPQMAVSLGSSALDLKLAITSYLLTLAMFIPISGYMADKFGTKRTFFLALFIFLLGSLIYGLSFNIEVLIFGRLVQGMGAAFITPVGRLILLKAFSRADFLPAFSVYVMIGQLGTILGPVLGGVITTFIDWRWIFLVNIPVVLLALYFTKKKIPDYHDHSNAAPFDWLGFVLFGFAAGMVTFGLSWVTEENFTEMMPWYICGAGVVLSVIYYFYGRRVAHPSLDLSAFRIRTFWVTMAGGSLFRLSSNGLGFLIPLQLQLVYGYSPLVAGLLLFPNAVAFMVARFFFKKLLVGLGFKKVLLLFPVFSAVSLLGLAFMSGGNLIVMMTVCMVLQGFTASVHYAALNTLTFADIPAKDSSKATSLSTVVQQIALSLAVCLAAGLLLSISDVSGHPVMTSSVFQLTYLLLSFLMAFSAVVFFKLLPTDGRLYLEAR